MGCMQEPKYMDYRNKQLPLVHNFHSIHTYTLVIICKHNVLSATRIFVQRDQRLTSWSQTFLGYKDKLQLVEAKVPATAQRWASLCAHWRGSQETQPVWPGMSRSCVLYKISLLKSWGEWKPVLRALVTSQNKMNVACTPVWSKFSKNILLVRSRRANKVQAHPVIAGAYTTSKSSSTACTTCASHIAE